MFRIIAQYEFVLNEIVRLITFHVITKSMEEENDGGTHYFYKKNFQRSR